MLASLAAAFLFHMASNQIREFITGLLSAREPCLPRRWKLRGKDQAEAEAEAASLCHARTPLG